MVAFQDTRLPLLSLWICGLHCIEAILYTVIAEGLQQHVLQPYDYLD